MMKTSTGGIPNQFDVLAELGYKVAGHCPFTEEEYKEQKKELLDLL